MPRISMKGHNPPAKPTGPAVRFHVAPTIDGYEVVDADGRSVTDAYPFANKPLVIAGRLNDAAAVSKQALARALGVVDADDEDGFVDDEAVETLCHVTS